MIVVASDLPWCVFDLPDDRTGPEIQVWVLAHEPLDEEAGPDTPCQSPVTYGLNAGGTPVLVSRMDADPESPTLRELAWRAVARHAGGTNTPLPGVDPSVPVLDYPDTSAFVATSRDRLQAALGCGPLMDYRPLDEADHQWLHSRAEAIGYALGQATGRTMPLGPGFGPGVLWSITSGQRVRRPGFYPGADTSALTDSYRYRRLVVTTPMSELLAADATGRPLPWEFYDELLQTSFERGCNAALADRLGIVPNPFTVAADQSA